MLLINKLNKHNNNINYNNTKTTRCFVYKRKLSKSQPQYTYYQLFQDSFKSLSMSKIDLSYHHAIYTIFIYFLIQ